MKWRAASTADFQRKADSRSEGGPAFMKDAATSVPSRSKWTNFASGNTSEIRFMFHTLSGVLSPHLRTFVSWTRPW